jgi:hypothetical protein
MGAGRGVIFKQKTTKQWQKLRKTTILGAEMAANELRFPLPVYRQETGNERCPWETAWKRSGNEMPQSLAK